MYCSLILLAALGRGIEVNVPAGEDLQAAVGATVQQTEIDLWEWLTYADYSQIEWVTWGFPERATKFDPTDFGLTYPFQIARRIIGDAIRFLTAD